MAKRIGVLAADEPLTSDPATCTNFVSKNVARYLVRKLLARKVGPRVIQMLEVAAAEIRQVIVGFWDGPLGIGNVLPFSRPTDPLHHSHYEIPMAGDRTCFARHRRKKIRVSARSRAPYAAQPVPTSHMAHALLAG
jgi:hypothetical protein